MVIEKNNGNLPAHVDKSVELTYGDLAECRENEEVELTDIEAWWGQVSALVIEKVLQEPLRDSGDLKVLGDAALRLSE